MRGAVRGYGFRLRGAGIGVAGLLVEWETIRKCQEGLPGYPTDTVRKMSGRLTDKTQTLTISISSSLGPFCRYGVT
ncbi:hypothetical protein M404DRAFT_1008689 [Pisolithus tinctorius Marx 270]|uniref:Uncharacterized protein n=1 Tax=Pisolithus tinctorius Marx 270 TaxID=870435 RepID=A0A0C3I9Y4_PISTI|nr:hypothetical protein M404DRAFT_1008689 [Pisolithus tinctorius Marx 270]